MKLDKLKHKQEIDDFRELKNNELLKLKKDLKLKRMQCNEGQGGGLPIAKRGTIKKQIAKINTILKER